jgi:hypothetical protein
MNGIISDDKGAVGRLAQRRIKCYPKEKQNPAAKARSLMNAKCRVQNAKVKVKEYKSWPGAIPQFCNLHFEI